MALSDVVDRIDISRAVPRRTHTECFRQASDLKAGRYSTYVVKSDSDKID